MPMRFNKLSTVAALVAGVAVLALSAGAAQADERWDRDRDRDRDHHWDHHDRYHHDYDRYRHDRYVYEYVHERPVIVRERAPVIVERERPVYMAPPVAYPMAPQGPSGLNLNFNIPLN